MCAYSRVGILVGPLAAKVKRWLGFLGWAGYSSVFGAKRNSIGTRATDWIGDGFTFRVVILGAG